MESKALKIGEYIVGATPIGMANGSDSLTGKAPGCDPGRSRFKAVSLPQILESIYLTISLKIDPRRNFLDTVSDIILLEELIEQRTRKQAELEFYQAELDKLLTKMRFVQKEIVLTQTIIDIIEKEQLVDIREYIEENPENSS